ncbi:hypothetical protein L7F22_016153 [Adiantum nelumboides]|nr:hypothetical protein [Adiantum nelumboides]
MLKALPNGLISAVIYHQIAIALNLHTVYIAPGPHHRAIAICKEQLLVVVHLELDKLAALLEGGCGIESPHRDEKRGASIAAALLLKYAQADGEGDVGWGGGGGLERAEETQGEAFRAGGEGRRAEDGGEERKRGDVCVGIERGGRGGEGEVGREAPERREGESLGICSV